MFMDFYDPINMIFLGHIDGKRKTRRNFAFQRLVLVMVAYIGCNGREGTFFVSRFVRQMDCNEQFSHFSSRFPKPKKNLRQRGKAINSRMKTQMYVYVKRFTWFPIKNIVSFAVKCVHKSEEEAKKPF
jgi:hypothetical protein